MKMIGLEKFFVRSALRVYFQRRFEAQKVLANLDLSRGSVCLEIGCGHGAGALLINQYLDCKLIVGVDIDPDMIQAAKKYIYRRPRWARNIRTDNIEFVCQDAAKLSFPDSCFDAAFLFGVLDHITEWPKVIPEVFRVLKAGGFFSFEEFLLGESSKNRFGHVAISEMELKDILTRSGFSIQSFEMTKHIPRCFVRAVKNNYSPHGKEMSR